jgi:hypothetical protein
MSTFKRILVGAVALALLGGPASLALRASAQEVEVQVPVYETWQPTWDKYTFDTKHVILGIVTDFSPYRLTVQTRDGNTQTVDLKEGTVIRPKGDTPAPGERVALVGRYSNGTFIANRVVLRPPELALAGMAELPAGIPDYATWQPDWDKGTYDTRHVMLGTVADFSPYRLTIARADGLTETIDLKNGTVIRPTGATPTQGEHVALVGYYSNGTFIANRVVLRP